MNITKYFNLNKNQEKVEFLDINLDTDNRLFIDPRLISISKNKHSNLMREDLKSFWSKTIKLVKNKSDLTIHLSGLSEPNETKLGYAIRKKKGNSIAEKIKPKLINAIRNNKAVRTGIISDFSDSELFIEDIGPDRISDITTKVIKLELINFTQEQCRIHGIPMTVNKQIDIYDRNSSNWISKDVELPYYNGKPILFVPKDIVRKGSLSKQNLSCFYRYAIRHFISKDTDMIEDISGSGIDGKLLLRDVKAKYPLKKISLSNWITKHGKLLVDYKSDVLHSKIKPMLDVDIMSILYY